ncbi:hypothetical protein MMC34_000969 [Xylographa carneopallida]|nr:hypothetical protein [Xylographa carneopallida]
MRDVFGIIHLVYPEDPEGLVLNPWQVVGLVFAIEQEKRAIGGGIIGDDCSVGKTILGLSTLAFGIVLRPPIPCLTKCIIRANFYCLPSWHHPHLVPRMAHPTIYDDHQRWETDNSGRTDPKDHIERAQLKEQTSKTRAPTKARAPGGLEKLHFKEGSHSLRADDKLCR